MGLTSTGRYVSVRRNAESANSKFGYDKETGYFGSRLKGKDDYHRTIQSDNPIADAKELFEAMADGGEPYGEQKSNLIIRQLPDKTIISLRIITSTKDSPAVDINIKFNPYNTKVKNQKIHFVKGGQ